MGINYSGVKVIENIKTDGRIIFVDKNGNNRMMGYGNCIKQLTPDMILNKNMQEVIEDADIIMIQMKMPENTVEAIINYCYERKKIILVDPTPADKSSLLVKKGLLEKSTFLTPNEDEAYTLSQYIKGYSFEQIQQMFKKTPKQQRIEEIRELIQKYPNVIATLGENGVVYNNNGRIILKKPFKTQCKDSTGAGDTFNGAFTAAIIRGEDLDKAIDYALMASSMKVGYEGAQQRYTNL